MFEEKEERVVCEGCRTGNYFLCNSFPGKASNHAEREVQYRKYKAMMKGRELKRIQSYQTEADGV